MQRSRGLLATCALVMLAGLPTALACSAPRDSEAPRDTTSAFGPALARAPLDSPLVLNGGFGEYRSNHFHAGLDLGTGQRVGRPVYAPLSGWIERVRTSGVGYGRALYLHSDDGRLLVFAHLDAFAGPVASFVAAAQDSSGQYEQDLWPASGRFRVAAGQTIAWTGESGAGGPHLHFEIRRGDVAYSPLRAGFALADTSAPTLTSVTLEPLDDRSLVARGAAPRTLRLGATPETVLVEGRVRAIVGARDGIWVGVDRMLPYAVRIEFDGQFVECRFDSLSWATDMVESAYVFDGGRVTGDKGLVMWAPAGFRPRVLHTSAPEGGEAGTLEMRPGDPPRTLTIGARDLAGNERVRRVVLRAPAAHETGPDTTRAGGRKVAVSEVRRFEFAMLPGGFWRVTFRGAPAASRGVRIGPAPATTNGTDWTAVVNAGGGTAAGRVRWTAAGRSPEGPWRFESPDLLLANAAELEEAGQVARWRIAPEALFESGTLGARTESDDDPRAGSELLSVSALRLRFEPQSVPLRRPARIAIQRPRADALPPGIAGARRVAVCRTTGDGWDWLGDDSPSAGELTIETRQLGTFALFADTTAPRLALLRPARGDATLPYSRWELRARITELGSGLDARATRFEVDGRPVPSEWDAEARILRWRPMKRPAAGAHRVTVVAGDRAGNVRRLVGRFTVD